MKFKHKYLHCTNPLIVSYAKEINEINEVIGSIKWQEEKEFTSMDKKYYHQAAYNKIFEVKFEGFNWIRQPKLSKSPRLIGDFEKKSAFIEVQFGNSSTLYRDFYKFQYGFKHNLIKLAILIVPENENVFFPTRIESVRNMANYNLANRYFTVLPVSVPTLIIGLLPEN